MQEVDEFGVAPSAFRQVLQITNGEIAPTPLTQLGQIVFRRPNFDVPARSRDYQCIAGDTGRGIKNGIAVERNRQRMRRIQDISYLTQTEWRPLARVRDWDAGLVTAIVLASPGNGNCIMFWSTLQTIYPPNIGTVQCLGGLIFLAAVH